jgi:hypothetical protein
MTRRRAGLAGIVAVLLALTLGGWRLQAAPPGPAAGAGVPTAGRVATSGGSHAWYCAGATAVKSGQADGTVVLANSGPAVLRGTATFYANQSGPGTPAPVSRPVAIGPYARASLRIGDVLAAPFAAATVVFLGPGGSAELQVSSALGTAAAPCATAPSGQWYLAAGTTKDGASDLLALFNPFPEDAIADLSFADDSGPEAPAGFQGIFVPGRSLVMVDLGSHLIEQGAVSATVGVRVGRLVAAGLQLDSIPGQVGLSVVTAAPAPAPAWWLPAGVVGPGLAEQVHVYDPTGAPARVTVEVHLARGQAAPFHLDLDPGSQQVLDLSAQPRIPAGDDFSITVRSRGAPVVVERTVQAVPPAPRTGAAEMLASPGTARGWQVTAGGATSVQDEWLVVADPGPRPATIRVSYLDQGVERPVPDLGQVVVPAGGHTQLRLGDHLQVADLGLLVESDVPVVVERDLYQVKGVGVSLAIPSEIED